MSDETTPLNPISIFTGDASPRPRLYKTLRLQGCIGILILFALIIALFIAFTMMNSRRKHIGADSAFILTADDQCKTTSQHETTVIRSKKPLPDESETSWSPTHKSLKIFSEHAISVGIKALGDREVLEETMQPIPSNSPAFRHYRSLSSNSEARKLAQRGYIENASTHMVAHLLNYTKLRQTRGNIGRGPRIVLPDFTLNTECDFNEKYRRANGACNNKAFAEHYGVALQPYRRMVAPDYADGISTPRASHYNSVLQLPSARKVSLNIHRASYETDSNFTVMLAVFGQFLDHDITATSLSVTQEGESINCCTMPLSQHPECFSVPIEITDPYYQQFNVTCMNFVRSAPAPTGHFGPRQQFNQATAYIDGSVVYGNSMIHMNHLRTQINGSLRMYITQDGRELLPLSSNSDDGCNRLQMLREEKYCFESGDSRANENLLLTSMHLLWARHHNYLARGLHKLNPDWDDETIFQESRRILAAQMAHITYNEFLPILLGREIAREKGLISSIMDINASDTYDPQVDATIANCFAAAAFRFAHTLLPKLFRISNDNSTPEFIELHRILFNPFSLWSKFGIDNALLAAVHTSVQKVDRFFSIELTQRLFEGTAEDKLPICGLDLVSLNIQRGRDHGLPSYPVFRRHCKLTPVNTWEQMAKVIDSNSLASMRLIYNTPDDVDVYTGALSEPPMSEGAIFGPLLTCLVSDQFLRLKKGDSHWYERKLGPQRFSKDQLLEIYKTTLAKIMCINSDSLIEVRMFVMEKWHNQTNEYISCKNTEFDFSAWAVDRQVTDLHRVGFKTAALQVQSIKADDVSE